MHTDQQHYYIFPQNTRFMLVYTVQTIMFTVLHVTLALYFISNVTGPLVQNLLTDRMRIWTFNAICLIYFSYVSDNFFTQLQIAK